MECKLCGVRLGREKEGFQKSDEFYGQECSLCKGHVCKSHLAFTNPPTCTDCIGD